MKIAWFSPFYRDGGDIARYGAAACGGLLADGHEVFVFAPDLCDGGLGIRTDVPITALDYIDREEVLRQLPEFDLTVFNLGVNANDYGKIYEFAREHPGVVVLHDLVIRPFFEAYWLRERGDRAGLLRLMEYSHGRDGRTWMEAVLDGRIADAGLAPQATEYHMARAAVAGALGVIVHSEDCRARIAELAGAPVVRLAFPVPDTAEMRRYGRDFADFAEGLRSLRPVLNLTDRAGRLVREMTDGPGVRVVLERLAGEIGWLADDDPAASAPRRRRAAYGGGVARADRPT
jgi:hypothetical protein